MAAEEIIREISDFCRGAGLAESTFGRLSVNDGKLVSRLRDGGSVTIDTLARLRDFMANHVPGERGTARVRSMAAAPAARPSAVVEPAVRSKQECAVRRGKATGRIPE